MFMYNWTQTSLLAQYEEYNLLEKQRWQNLENSGVSSWADVWEESADLWSNRFVVQEVNSQKSWTYQDLDHAADKIAQWGISTQDKFIGIYQPNGALLLAAIIGLAKAGVIAVLFNTQQPKNKLSELAELYKIRLVLGDTIPELNTQDIAQLLDRPWLGRTSKSAREKVELNKPAVIIFTSGTSGRSKPALFSHRRLIGAGINWSMRTKLTFESRCYITLPLYHGNGLAIAFSSCVEAGACAVVRDRFSVRAFFPDIREYRCDAAVYIGELWRYLLNQPPKGDDADNPLRVIFGNGLNASIWTTAQQRFAIEHIVEHYGATEMPASALTNWTNRPGYCGFIPPNHPDATNVVLVDDHMQPVPLGQPGQALLRVSGSQYRGYLDATLDEEKVKRNLLEVGDLWWKSGDLLNRDDQGFFTFVDRLGDNFRWKGENVASIEVEDALLATGLILEAAVYGVPITGSLGKVGMASILPKLPLDEKNGLNTLLLPLIDRLPSYAIPHLLRLVPQQHETTSTLKIKKTLLANEGFQLIDKYPHFVLHKGQYVSLTTELLDALNKGELSIGFR